MEQAKSDQETDLRREPGRATELRKAAFDLAREQGLTALTARNLSKVTGTRPAAINYYFGHREKLISEIAGLATLASEDWRSERSAIDLREAPIWGDLDQSFTCLVQSRLSADRHLLALVQELEHEAAGTETRTIRDILAREAEADAAFWRNLARDHDESDAAAEAWASLAAGLTGLLLSEEDADRRSVWISAPAERLRKRMLRLEIRLIPGDGPDARSFALAPAGSETAQAILDSTLSIVAETGPDRLQLREVAQRTGVSLAAVTYFFRTKGDLVRAAFVELCRRHCLTLTTESPTPSSGSVAEMLSFHDDEGLRGMAAMETMLRAAVRSPELAPTAALIRQVRGIASYVLLQRLGLAVDHLDAYLWACLLAGHYRMIRFLPLEQQQHELNRATELFLETVFNWRRTS